MNNNKVLTIVILKCFIGYYAAANRTGKQLNLPVYSIDRLIFECLTSQCVEAAKTLLQIVNTEFDDVASEADMTAVLNEGIKTKQFIKFPYVALNICR